MKPGGRPGRERPGKPWGKAPPRPRKGKRSCLMVGAGWGGEELGAGGGKYLHRGRVRNERAGSPVELLRGRLGSPGLSFI